VGERVVDDVAEDPFECARVDGCGEVARGDVEGELADVFGVRDLAASDDGGGDLRDVGFAAPRALGGAEGEELVREVSEPCDVDGKLVENGFVLRAGTWAASGELDAALEESQRCAELVAGVVDEPAFVLDGPLEGGEHLVEGVPEAGDLVVSVVRYVEAQTVGSSGDLRSAATVPLNWT
jgi:hypothetical protein